MKNNVIEKLLVSMDQELEFISGFKKYSFKEYGSDQKTKKAVERSLQIAIQVFIDVSLRIAARESLVGIESYGDAVQKLVDNKIYPKKLGKLAPLIISVRNRLVHNYDKIDDAVIYGIIQKKMKDFSYIKKVIEKYLEA